MKLHKVLSLGLLALGASAGFVMAQDAGRRGGPGPLSPLVTALDANQDGRLDREEIKNATAALKKLDQDADGELSGNELRPPGLGGPGIGGPGSRGGPGRGFGGQSSSSGFDSTPLAKDEAEKKLLAVLDEMNRRSRGMMSVPRDDGRFLRMLVETLGARNVVEVGTSQGYSAIWIALALQTTGGRLTTFEIDAGRAQLARENFQRAGVEGLVKLVEGDAHVEVPKLTESIDLLFLDADKEGYLDYLEKLLPLVRPGGLVVAHNMSARQADPRYVQAITTNPKLETLFVNLRDSGIGLTMKKR